MDPIMEADMKDHAVVEAVPAQPTMTHDEPARDLLLDEVGIDGVCRVH
jgi:hypothetical protein